MLEAWVYPSLTCTGLGDRLGLSDPLSLSLSLSARQPAPRELHGLHEVVHATARIHPTPPDVHVLRPGLDGVHNSLQDLHVRASEPANIRYYVS